MSGRGLIEKVWIKIELPESLAKALKESLKDEPPPRSSELSTGTTFVLTVFLTLGGLRLLLDIVARLN